MSSEKQKTSAMNIVFIALLGGAIVCSGFSGKMELVGGESVKAAKDAVNLGIGLIGVMALWLGLVRVLEAGGFMNDLARFVKPVMVRLFPDVPGDHPAMGAMVLNISANMLGLGNAATPFGLKAMTELNRLNPLPGIATNAMCLFLAINTAGFTLFPLGAIAVRMAAGSSRPAEIFLPTFISMLVAGIAGIVVARFCARRDSNYRLLLESAAPLANDSGAASVAVQSPATEDYSRFRVQPTPGTIWIGRSFFIFLSAAMIVAGYRAESLGRFLTEDLLSYWLMPSLMLLIVIFGISRGVRIYEAVVDGAKQGFDLVVKIIPFLVTILVSVAMFRVSGAMDVVTTLLNPLTQLLGMPAEVLPMALVRPLSGSGAFAIMSAITEQNPNSYSAYLAATINGCTETTFYVLAVYFGAVGIGKVRHAVMAGLAADIAGVFAACAACKLFWQG